MTLRHHSAIGNSATDLASLGPDCYCVFSPELVALHVGANAGAVLGISACELTGAKFLECVHVQDRAAVAKAIADCAAKGGPTRTPLRMRNAGDADGRHDAVWLEMRCVALKEGMAGEPGPAVLAVFGDRSEHSQLQAELAVAREHVEGIGIAKGRFLANMSHELRTPLNAILGFSELLQSDVMKSLPSERRQEYVGLIHTSARHLLQVVNDILDMSKMDAGKYEIVREPFDLGPVLRECCAMMRTQAEQKGLSLSADGIAEMPEICADARAVKQIVINLLSNAVKFTAPGGHVEISAERRGRSIEIRVRDNGIGISADHLANLGTPFYQADSKYDRKYEGTGLGLSLVFGLVELHGGRVTIRSRRNAGTTVAVLLPLDGARQHPVPATEEFDVIRADRSVGATQAKSAARGAR